MLSKLRLTRLLASDGSTLKQTRNKWRLFTAQLKRAPEWKLLEVLTLTLHPLFDEAVWIPAERIFALLRTELIGFSLVIVTCYGFVPINFGTTDEILHFFHAHDPFLI